MLNTNFQTKVRDWVRQYCRAYLEHDPQDVRIHVAGDVICVTIIGGMTPLERALGEHFGDEAIAKIKEDALVHFMSRAQVDAGLGLRVRDVKLFVDGEKNCVNVFLVTNHELEAHEQ